jgi:uncharacterized protein (TIGR00369 family)
VPEGSGLIQGQNAPKKQATRARRWQKVRMRIIVVRMQTISTSRVDNRINQLVRRVEALPVPRAWQQRLVTLGVGLTVPYLATSSVRFVEMTDTSVTLLLKNRRPVQNHMKSVHASAMFLLAEAATGTVLSANLPEGSRFSTTHIEVDYLRRAEGDLTAIATLSDEQRASIRANPKGKLTVPVRMLDQNGNEPASFVVEWSWKHASKAPAGVTG